MGMFNSMRKPRGFNHQYIYVDERKEKLDKMEEQAKRDLVRKIFAVNSSKVLHIWKEEKQVAANRFLSESYW